MKDGSAPATELERVLGLPATMAIGVGTMIGAGIFVFPGLAAERAGPAAIVSFLLGGFVALLVAASTAQLATAMPGNGGAYQYATRVFGRFAGFLVGIAQCVGLVFATGFYLVAFGEYTNELLAALGWTREVPVPASSIAAGLVLVAVNLVGTSDAGRLQNLVVGVLAASLVVLFGFGAFEIVTGEIGVASRFAPRGLLPIFTTTALVFTSYLGFVQIATVAGEVRRPNRNLPIALIGSVVLVALLYALALFVTTSVVPRERLADLGEAATVEVARILVGWAGGAAMLALGLLATISSANASILASSRSLHALARDGLAPDVLGKVHRKLETPHYAVLAVAAPLWGLVFLSRLDLLAQVASVLHLAIYTVVCASLFALERTPSADLEPGFRVPAARWLAACGVAATIVLQAFMAFAALAIGAGVLLAGAAGYGIHRRVGSEGGGRPGG